MRKRNSNSKRRALTSTIILSIIVFSLFWACDFGQPPQEDPTPEDPTLSVLEESPLLPDPSWDCGMPAGIPSPQNGELVFEANMTLGSTQDLGQTQYGDRQVFVITGGTVSGPNINAEVLNGGLDYQLTLANGAMEIEQINTLQTSDGTNIYFRSCGASSNTTDVRMVPDFEAPDKSDYSFLNTGQYVGTRELSMNGKSMTIKVYDVSHVTVDSNVPGAVSVTQPSGVPNQSWDCKETDIRQKGDALFTETVTLGKTIEVGDSKNGERKIAPITGGKIAAGGRIAGEVLFGGADYQIFGSTSTDVYVDARYTIKTSDGELIIVRNCGPLMPLMTLAPSFETSKDNKYSYLNNARWQSGFPTPNAAQTQVTINLFEYPGSNTEEEEPESNPGVGTFNGTYSIIAAHSGKALELYNWGTQAGTNVVQWNNLGNNNQKFKIAPTGIFGVWHSIIPVSAPLMSLDVAGCSPDVGANIQIWNYWGADCQQFRFEHTGNDLYRIIPRNSGLCLDVLNASPNDGANVMQYNCLDGAQHQMFKLVSQ